MSEWTKTPPSEPGFYWHKWDSPYSKPVVIKVELVRTGWWDDKVELSCFQGARDCPPVANLPGSMWSGPLAPP